MRRWLLFLIAAFSSLSFAGTREKHFSMYNFSGGLNSYYSPYTIADNEVQSALNVYFDKDNAVVKRTGYDLYASTIAVSFDGAWTYTDATNNAWLIVRSSDSIRASSGNGKFTVIIATCPSITASRVSAVNAFGKIYFVDSVQGVYSWDGSTVQYSTSSPKGTLITEFHGRLWASGLAVPNQNYLYASAYLDGSNWTTGTLSTDPVLFQVGLNDREDGITALYSGYNDTLYVFKNLSINAVYGFDQTDFTVRTLSREAGCIDAGSLQPWKGYLIFMSQRGLEQFDGYLPVRISMKVKDKVDPATKNTFNQRTWTQDSDKDFGAGTFTNAVYIDTETIPGLLQTTFPDSFDTLRDGTNGTKAVWTQYNSGSTTGSASISSNQLALNNNGSTLGRVNLRTVSPLETYQQGTAYLFYVNQIPSDSGNLSRFILTFSSMTSPSQNPDSLSNRWSFTFISSNTGTCYLASASDDTGDSIFVSTNNIPMPFIFDVFLATNTFSYSINGRTIMSGSHTWPNRPIYAYLSYERGTAGPGTCLLDTFSVIPQDPSYTSQTETLGTNITSFGNFDVTQSITYGTISYTICTSPNSDMSSATCAAQTINSLISVATNTYVTVKASFNTISAYALSLGQFTIHWNEGVPRPRMQSIIYDDRYYLSLATSTSDNFNEAVLVLAQGAQGAPVFSLFDWKVGGFVLYKGNVYIADSQASGNVYSLSSNYFDYTQGINAYFRTKAYAPEGLNEQKYWDSVYIMLQSDFVPYTFYTNYYLDEGNTYFAALSRISLNENGTYHNAGFVNSRLPFPIDPAHPDISSTISFLFYSTDYESPFTFYGADLIYKVKPQAGELNAP